MSYTSGRLYAGQKTGITTSAVQISTTSKNVREVVIQSDPANTTNMLVGDSAGQYVVITPGQAINLSIISLSLVYVVMTSGTGIANWVGID